MMQTKLAFRKNSKNIYLNKSWSKYHFSCSSYKQTNSTGGKKPIPVTSKFKLGPLSVSGPLECPFSGKVLLNSPYYNKGAAFPIEERKEFDLEGLLPSDVPTLETQVSRAYDQFSRRKSALLKNTFLASMKDQNTVLYYRLIQDHLKEMFSIIYTPTQGEFIENYSHLFRRPEGCFLDIEHPENIDIAISKWGSARDIDYIVVTDSEAILGIGDQGVGGIGISIAKLALMTLCGGIHPSRTMPVVLDVGTNRQSLLDDPLYMGRRIKRVTGKRYDDFVDNFVQAVKKRFPYAFLHFEDFGLSHANAILQRYTPQLPCFNDDIQGTGAVAAAALYAGLDVQGKQLKDARILVYGAGSAGMGITEQIYDIMILEGATPEQARKNIFLIDRNGLILKSQSKKLTDAQKPFAAPDSDWNGKDTKDLTKIISEIKPHVLIGCSTHAGAFTESAIREMAKHVERPCIFPLSNPTKLAEAVPADILKWTDYRALVATGSPFAPVDGRAIAENNNCFAFPGIGFGCVLTRAKRLTKEVIIAAIKELSKQAPIYQDHEKGSLMPDVAHIREVSARVATAVVLENVRSGLARTEELHGVKIPTSYNACLGWVKDQMWKAEYRPLKRV